MTSAAVLQASILERQHNKLRVRGETEQDMDHLIGPRRRKFFPSNGVSNDDFRAKSEQREVEAPGEVIAVPEETQPLSISAAGFSRKSSLTRSRSAGPSLRKKLFQPRSEYKEAFRPWIIAKTIPSPAASVHNESNITNGTTKEELVTVVEKIQVNGDALTRGKREVSISNADAIMGNGSNSTTNLIPKESSQADGQMMSTSLPANTDVFWSGDDKTSHTDVNEKRHFTTANKGPGVLFSKEARPIDVSSEDLNKIGHKRKTEYKSAFKPFWKYTYIASEGRFRKIKDIQSGDQTDSPCQGDTWRELCKERHDCALAFQKRSQSGHPIIGQTLESVYQRSMYLPKDRSIAALALATTRLRIQDLKSEKSGRNRSQPERRVTRSVSGTRTRPSRDTSSASTKAPSSKSTPIPPKSASEKAITKPTAEKTVSKTTPKVVTSKQTEKAVTKPKEEKVWMQPKVSASSQDQPKPEPSKPVAKPVSIAPTLNPTPAERKTKTELEKKDSVIKPPEPKPTTISSSVTSSSPNPKEEPLLVFATCTPANGINGDCSHLIDFNSHDDPIISVETNHHHEDNSSLISRTQEEVVEKKVERKESWFSRLKKRKSSKGDDVVVDRETHIETVIDTNTSHVKTSNESTPKMDKKEIQSNGK